MCIEKRGKEGAAATTTTKKSAPNKKDGRKSVHPFTFYCAPKENEAKERRKKIGRVSCDREKN